MLSGSGVQASAQRRVATRLFCCLDGPNSIRNDCCEAKSKEKTAISLALPCGVARFSLALPPHAFQVRCLEGFISWFVYGCLDLMACIVVRAARQYLAASPGLFDAGSRHVLNSSSSVNNILDRTSRLKRSLRNTPPYGDSVCTREVSTSHMAIFLIALLCPRRRSHRSRVGEDEVWF